MSDSRFTPEEHLSSDLGNLVMAWQELGIDPDDFVKCATCKEYIIEEDGSERECACDRHPKNCPVCGGTARLGAHPQSPVCPLLETTDGA